MEDNNDKSVDKLFEFLSNIINETIEKDDRFNGMFNEIGRILGNDQLINLVSFISNMCVSSVFNGILYNNCIIYNSLNYITKNMSKTLEDVCSEDKSMERISKIESDIENIKISIEILRKHINDISSDITINKIIK